MKQLIKALKESVDDTFSLPMSARKLIVEEKQSGATCKSITLQSASSNIFGLTFDVNLSKGCRVFPFFNSQAGLSKVNDAIVFYTRGKKLFLVLIELKSNNPGIYLKQLKAGRVIAMFLLETIGNSNNKTYDIENENIRCVLFDTRKTPPKGTSQRKGKGVSYENRDGLFVAHQPCNDVVQFEKLLEAF